MRPDAQDTRQNLSAANFMYSPRRTIDRAVRTGDLSVVVGIDETGVTTGEHGSRSILGALLCVRSVALLDSHALRLRERLTSFVTNILSSEAERVVFEAGSGSWHVWQKVSDLGGPTLWLVGRRRLSGTHSILVAIARSSQGSKRKS